MNVWIAFTIEWTCRNTIRLTGAYLFHIAHAHDVWNKYYGIVKIITCDANPSAMNIQVNAKQLTVTDNANNVDDIWIASKLIDLFDSDNNNFSFANEIIHQRIFWYTMNDIRPPTIHQPSIKTTQDIDEYKSYLFIYSYWLTVWRGPPSNQNQVLCHVFDGNVIIQLEYSPNLIFFFVRFFKFSVLLEERQLTSQCRRCSCCC